MGISFIDQSNKLHRYFELNLRTISQYRVFYFFRKLSCSLFLLADQIEGSALLPWCFFAFPFHVTNLKSICLLTYRISKMLVDKRWRPSCL